MIKVCRAFGRTPLIWNDLSRAKFLLKELFKIPILLPYGGRAGKIAKEKGGQGIIDDRST